MFTTRRVLAALAFAFGLSFVALGLPTHVAVRDARIVSAYEQDDAHGSTFWLKFHFSGPGARSIDDLLENPGAVYTVAKRSRLPLPVRVRVRAEMIQAIQIGGKWYGTGEPGRTAGLIIGGGFLAIGFALVAAPWLRRNGRFARARAW